MSKLSSAKGSASAFASASATRDHAASRRPRNRQIGRRQVDPGHRKSRVIPFDLGEKAASAAGDIEQPGRTRAARSFQQRLAQRHQRLPAHRRRAAAEQHLDLVIVALGGGGAQIAVALEVEMAAIVGGVVLGLGQRQQAVARVAVPAGIDGAEIAEEIGCPADFGERVAAPLLRRRVKPGRDVAPVLLQAACAGRRGCAGGRASPGPSAAPAASSAWSAARPAASAQSTRTPAPFARRRRRACRVRSP